MGRIHRTPSPNSGFSPLAQAHKKLTSVAPVRVAIIENSRYVAELVHRLCLDWKLVVVMVSHSGPRSPEDIVKARPNLILINLNLPDCDTMVLVQKINAALPDARIIALCSELTEYHLYRLAQLTIHGWVDTKADGIPRIRSAIDRVRQGATRFSASYRKKSQQLKASQVTYYRLLTTREQEVLTWITHSYSDAEIAVHQGISLATAQTRRRDVLRKTKSHSTPQLIRYGLKLGLIEPTLIATQSIDLASRP